MKLSDRWTDRHMDMQTDRQTDRQTDMDRQTDRHGQADRQTDREAVLKTLQPHYFLFVYEYIVVSTIISCHITNTCLYIVFVCVLCFDVL